MLGLISGQARCSADAAGSVSGGLALAFDNRSAIVAVAATATAGNRRLLFTDDFRNVLDLKRTDVAKRTARARKRFCVSKHGFQS